MFMKSYIKPVTRIIYMKTECQLLEGSTQNDPTRTSGWTSSDQKHGFGIYEEGYGKYEGGLNDDDLGAKGNSNSSELWDD